MRYDKIPTPTLVVAYYRYEQTYLTHVCVRARNKIYGQSTSDVLLASEKPVVLGETRL